MMNQKDKNKFRRSKKWTDFRKKLRKERKVDALTGKALTPRANLHHMDLDEDHYTNLTNEDNFLFLNTQSHEIIHFFYGHGKNRKDWRALIAKLVELLELHDKINNKE